MGAATCNLALRRASGHVRLDQPVGLMGQCSSCQAEVQWESTGRHTDCVVLESTQGMTRAATVAARVKPSVVTDAVPLAEL